MFEDLLRIIDNQLYLATQECVDRLQNKGACTTTGSTAGGRRISLGSESGLSNSSSQSASPRSETAETLASEGRQVPLVSIVEDFSGPELLSVMDGEDSDAYWNAYAEGNRGKVDGAEYVGRIGTFIRRNDHDQKADRGRGRWL